jgi:hypothetical protein
MVIEWYNNLVGKEEASRYELGGLPRGHDHRPHVKGGSVIELSVHADPEVRDHELVRCFRHEGRDCPRCDDSGYRTRKYCAACGEPAGQPSRGGKVLIGFRNRRGWDQPFYCLGCHPDLGRGLAMLERMCD